MHILGKDLVRSLIQFHRLVGFSSDSLLRHSGFGRHWIMTLDTFGQGLATRAVYQVILHHLIASFIPIKDIVLVTIDQLCRSIDQVRVWTFKSARHATESSVTWLAMHKPGLPLQRINLFCSYPVIIPFGSRCHARGNSRCRH